MTIAQKILSRFNTETATGAQELERECQWIATSSSAANCFDRVWTFYDGSTITKTRDGYMVK